VAVRREQVILDLQDNLTPGLARAAVAAGLLDRELASLGGTSVKSGRDLDKTSTATERIAVSSRRATPEVDRMSGRMRIFADAALTLGPALIPIGATAIPVLTAALAGLGASAGAIGVTVLAFKGLGDGLKALNTYQTAPTAENLQALRVEMEKMGGSGEHFVKFLDGLGPELTNLQRIARGGIFPGVEDGITDLLTRLPQVRRIVADLSDGMGDLAREGGAALAGDKFTAFFDYIESDARPTLEAFARSTGNVIEGVANMIVAFAPLSRDFTGGLVEASDAFVKWSQGLDDNQSFQNFVDYVRESGPQVIDFLGALVSAFAGLVKAAAPWGSLVLPVLTEVAKVFGDIAASPIGPGLYAAAAGMIAFNRAAQLASASSAKFSTAWAGMSRARLTAGVGGGLGLLALSLTDVDDKIGAANTAMDSMAGLMVGGPWGFAVGAGVGLIQDLNDAYQSLHTGIDAVDDSLRENDTTALLQEKADLLKQIAEGHPDDGTVGNWWKAFMGSYQDFTGATDDARGRIAEIDGQMREGGDVADLFGESIGMTGKQLRIAAGDADSFSGALARLNGWFDHREAVRNYQDAIDQLRKSLKNGFTREDAANLDAMGRSILQVSQGIKDKGLRANFLAEARAQLVDMAHNSGPKAAAAIQQVIDKFDDKGLTHPVFKPTVDDSRARGAITGLEHHTKRSFGIMNALKAKPTLDANDNPFQQTYGSVKHAMAQANRLRAKATLDADDNPARQAIAGSTVRLHKYGNIVSIAHANVDNSQATSAINQVSTMLRNLNGDSSTVFVRTVRTDIPLPGSADGTTVPKTGRGYADRHLYLLADGEEVISNRHGQADRNRSLLKAINANRMAGGGTAASTYTSSQTGGNAWHVMGGSNVWHEVTNAAHDAAEGLKGLKRQLKEQQKAYDKAKSARDAAVGRRDSLSSTIQQNLMGDSIFAASSGSVWAAGAFGANTPQGAIAALNARKDRAQRFVAALNTLKGKGVTGAALQEIISEGLEATEAMAASDATTLSTFATAVNDSASALAAAGLAGGNAVEGANVAATQKRLDRLHDKLKDIHQAIKDADSNNQTAAAGVGFHVVAGVNGAASNGHRRGR
jgi:hypothetical protein